MSMSEKTIWDKIAEFDIRWIYLLTIILIVIPVVHPLGIPIRVSKPVKDFYKTIDELPPGSVVAVSFRGSLGLLDEQEAQFLALWKILFQRDLKVIFYSPTADGEIILDMHLGKKVRPEDYGKKYGIDYVRLGYAPIGEPGEAAFALDIRSIFPTDYKGTPLDEIPMMKNINSWKDIDLLIFQYTACTDVEIVIRQWVVPYNMTVLTMTLGCCGPMTAPYYPKMIKGFLSGSIAGAELEIIGGVPGPGAAMTDAKNLGIFGLIVSLILGNLAYWGRRLSKEGGE